MAHDLREFVIRGDQWRIDADFMKWRYWASALGLQSHYRLSRIEGRFEEIATANAQAPTAHDLTGGAVLDPLWLVDALGPLNFLADASYGASTYTAIDPARAYRVYKTPTGIITRDEPRIVAEFQGEMLEIEIDRGCGEEPGYWARFSSWLNVSLIGLRADP